MALTKENLEMTFEKSFHQLKNYKMQINSNSSI